MRGSPISNLRGRQEYTTSPYESNPRSSNVGHQSPPRNVNYSSAGQVEYWRAKARQFQSQVIALNEELMFQIRKNEKIDDLQEKIELLLAQNTHFVQQNENLIQLVYQKKNQIQLLKKRLDYEHSNSSIAETEKKKIFDHLNIKDQEHQIQIQKLLSEITRLQNQLVQADNLKKLQIHRLKNQYESESIAQIQNLRRSQNGNNEIQELNIRKLKDVVDQKNFEIQNLNRQIRLKNEELKSQTNYSKNQQKKLQEQKAHELDLVKTEYENVKNNLIRQHKKNEEELKNLHQTKVKRLVYEIQEKKHEIQEGNNRLKRTGKEGEAELARLINQNGNLRNQLKDNDNRNRTRVQQLTAYYDSQFSKERETNLQRQANLRSFYENEISILQHVIAAKEQQIKRLLQINKDLKTNQEKRLQLIKENNYELKSKIADIVKHYQRQIQMTKIKVSHLYQTDLESLRSAMRTTYENHSRQTENWRELLQQARQKLAHEVQDRLDLRKDYELRLTQFGVSHDKIQKELKNVVGQRQKEIEGHTSKASLTHISHNQLLQNRNINMKQVLAQKRNLEAQITNKNRQIEALNLKVQQMLGLHKRDIQKLQEQVSHAKADHDAWLKRNEKQTHDWHEERDELSDQIQKLKEKIQSLTRQNQNRETQLKNINNEQALKISELKGFVHQLQIKVKQLMSKNMVEKENVEKTMLETRTLMNSEKDKLGEIVKREKQLLNGESKRVRSQLQVQISDLLKENDILRDNYQKSLIREEQLKEEVRGLADSVNHRHKLEQSVINIGLSNNYFKNVAQIFKRQLST